MSGLDESNGDVLKITKYFEADETVNIPLIAVLEGTVNTEATAYPPIK